MNNSKTKTAFIAIVGKPNVGKSSILNYLIGQKIAIVSKKPQTTRNRIMGILTKDYDQLVFIDTPGLHKPKNKLGDFMVSSVKQSIGSVDAALLVIDPTNNTSDIENSFIESFRKLNIPAILAINKIDLLKNKSDLAPLILNISNKFKFKSIVPVSAKSGEGMEDLLLELRNLALPGAHMFNDDDITDQPERIIASEIIREKMLRLLDKEIPHGVFVGIESMKERNNKNIIDIDAIIYCEKASHKGIIIGKGGSMLKKIGTFARYDMENFFDCQINLKLWVKVKEDWRNKESALRNFGYDKKSLDL